MTAQRIETIKQACIKVQGLKCLNANKTKPATSKAEKALLKLIDSVIESEYCSKDGEKDSHSELDFND